MSGINIESLSPDQAAKEYGAKSIGTVSQTVDVSTQCLWNWQKSRPVVFKALLIFTAEEIKKTAA